MGIETAMDGGSPSLVSLTKDGVKGTAFLNIWSAAWRKRDMGNERERERERDNTGHS